MQPTTDLMTSISQQQSISSQNPSSAIPSVASLQSPSFTGGTSSPQPSAAGRSHAGATRKQGAVANAGGPAHGRADSVSNINAKSSIPPAVPTFGGPTIVNGNNAVSSNSYQGDHTRKASVTISTSGTVGQMPTIAGKPTVGNPIQFGSMNSGQSPSISHSTPFSGPSANSLAVSSHANPRVTSPQTSPSPIPQPASSGGRPPSSLHGQNNGLSFGSIGGDGSSVRLTSKRSHSFSDMPEATARIWHVVIVANSQYSAEPFETRVLSVVTQRHGKRWHGSEQQP